MKIMPTTYFLVLLLSSVIFHFFFPVIQIVFTPYNYSGLALILFGIIINIWTDHLFKKNLTTVKPYEKPSCLVIAGPFKISRHPMYLGMASLLMGAAVFMGSAISFAFPLIFIILMKSLFIPKEEKAMQNAFGQKYLNYKNHVRQWI